MSDRSRTTGGSDRREAGCGGYFAPLTSARYLLLTTFKQNGMPVSTPVQGVVDGDRAYFRAWNRSGVAKRLRHTDGVQVTPCTALGLCSFGPPLDATARLLAGKEAGRAAGRLADKYPARRRFTIPVLSRRGRWQPAYYELLPRDGGQPAHEARELPASVTVVRADRDAGSLQVRSDPNAVSTCPSQQAHQGCTAACLYQIVRRLT